MGELRADPADLVRLAADTSTAASRLADGLADLVPLPADAFGDVDVGRSYAEVLAEVEALIGRLVAVHEGDVDRLYRVAFDYRRADAAAGRRIARGPW